MIRARQRGRTGAGKARLRSLAVAAGVEDDVETLLACPAGAIADRSRAPALALRAVVAIPVRDEAERIGACLDALAAQSGLGVDRVGILLLLNNCRDSTERIVATRRGAMTMPMRVIVRDHPGAHAGWARRAAMEAAASWLDEAGAQDGLMQDGIILTTDADSRAPADWARLNIDAIEAGADAVAGRITLDADEAALLPAALHARGRLEGDYEALLSELSGRIDPVPHDPWPCHGTASGATLAVRLSAYRRVGGMPALPAGEDRAFEARLLAHDLRVRHAPEIAVVTSGRLDGRAPGGAADTMRLRCDVPDTPCDPRLEPFGRAIIRAVSRRRLRRLHATGALAATRAWAPALGIPRAEAEAIARLPTLGRVLAAVAERSPRLSERPLRPHDLPRQIRLARAALGILRAAERAGAILRTIMPRPGGAALIQRAPVRRGLLGPDRRETLGQERAS